MTGGVIEIIRPIFNNEDVLGYVYLRDSTQTLENLIAQLIMVTLSVLLIGLLMCFTLKLQTANCKLQTANCKVQFLLLLCFGEIGATYYAAKGLFKPNRDARY